MDVLFVHNAFPAQFHNIASALSEVPGIRVAAIGGPRAKTVPGVLVERYPLPPVRGIGHPFSRRFELECVRAEQVMYAASALARRGFRPATVVVHCGWGEGLSLREVFPAARLISYAEYYYRSTGQDVGFDPEFSPLGVDGRTGVHIKNAATLLALADSDEIISPTAWQKALLPQEFQAKASVVHEGIDTGKVRPNAFARFKLSNGRILGCNDEVVTFVARNLEPLRGFHVFMRALPQILAARPRAQVLVIGGTERGYGSPPPKGSSWKQVFLDEIKSRADTSRVHFTGALAYNQYLAALQISSAHVYLTYPFVLSWSLLEAMSAGCVVIGSATEPVQEVVNGRNGILVPFFDVEGLAARVTDALVNPERYRPMRERARQTILTDFEQSRCVEAAKGIIMPTFDDILVAPNSNDGFIESAEDPLSDLLKPVAPNPCVRLFPEYLVRSRS